MDKRTILKKYGTDKKKVNGRIMEARARCAGCGEWISTAGDLTNAQVCVTKRGTAVFFHTDCMEKVWNTKIAND